MYAGRALLALFFDVKHLSAAAMLVSSSSATYLRALLLYVPGIYRI